MPHLVKTNFLFAKNLISKFKSVTHTGAPDTEESKTTVKQTYILLQLTRACQWALDKLKSKEIKASQLVRCGLKGISSIICCKDDSIHPIEIHGTSPKHPVGSDIYFPYVRICSFTFVLKIILLQWRREWSFRDNNSHADAK